MKWIFLFVMLLVFLTSCVIENNDYCGLSFNVEFINKNTGECYKNQDSVFSAYGLDSVCIYRKLSSFWGEEERCLNMSDNPSEWCISSKGVGQELGKNPNRTLLYVIGKYPNLQDTIEFKFINSVATIKINGVLQEQKAYCNQRVILQIEK